jgi:hypothetical protein
MSHPMELQVSWCFHSEKEKKLFGILWKYLGDLFHESTRQKEANIEEGHLHLDHVRICISSSCEGCGIQFGGVYQKEERLIAVTISSVPWSVFFYLLSGKYEVYETEFDKTYEWACPNTKLGPS